MGFVFNDGFGMRRLLASVLYRVARHLDPPQEVDVQERIDALNEATAELERRIDLLLSQPTTVDFVAELISGQIGRRISGSGIEVSY